MNPVLVLIVMFTFVVSLPQRFSPKPTATVYPAFRAVRVPPLDRWFYVLPPVKRESENEADLAEPDDMVSPAFGTAAVLYVFAFYSIFNDGRFGVTVIECIPTLMVVMAWSVAVAMVTIAAIKLVILLSTNGETEQESPAETESF